MPETCMGSACSQKGTCRPVPVHQPNCTGLHCLEGSRVCSWVWKPERRMHSGVQVLEVKRCSM